MDILHILNQKITHLENGIQVNICSDDALLKVFKRDSTEAFLVDVSDEKKRGYKHLVYHQKIKQPKKKYTIYQQSFVSIDLYIKNEPETTYSIILEGETLSESFQQQMGEVLNEFWNFPKGTATVDIWFKVRKV